MNFAIFLGILVVLAGASILLDAVFHVHLPLVRSAIALVFMAVGVRLLLGAWSPREKQVSAFGSAFMSDKDFAPLTASQPLAYDVVFARGTVDLTGIPRPDKPIVVEVTVIFGGAEVTVDPTLPLVVEGKSDFGEVRMPDESVAGVGSSRYRPKGQVGEPLIRVRVNALFGSCTVREASTQTHTAAAASPLPRDRPSPRGIMPRARLD